jgi:hypothetical protein
MQKEIEAFGPQQQIGIKDGKSFFIKCRNFYVFLIKRVFVGGVDAFVTSKNKNSKLNSELYHLSL